VSVREAPHESGTLTRLYFAGPTFTGLMTRLVRLFFDFRIIFDF